MTERDASTVWMSEEWARQALTPTRSDGPLMLPTDQGLLYGLAAEQREKGTAIGDMVATQLEDLIRRLGL